MNRYSQNLAFALVTWGGYAEEMLKIQIKQGAEQENAPRKKIAVPFAADDLKR